jgi:GntR family transcriptional regulator, transcriptional repressor for pyruvate dehydrogenase complex
MSRPAQRLRFEPSVIQSSSASDQIATQLRAALVDGRLQPGDRLGTEPELAGAFGVSRATVREAIKILRVQGVLRTSRGARGGHFIITPQADILAQSVGDTFGLWFEAGSISIAEVDEARVTVERACVRFAAVRRTPEQIARMRAILETSDDPLLSRDEFLACDTKFHSEIARAAGNRLLELPMTAIHFIRPRTNQLLRLHDRSDIVRQHTRLLDAIEAGDPDGAEAAFLHHASYLDEVRHAAVAPTHRSTREIALGEIDPGPARPPARAIARLSEPETEVDPGTPH